MVRFINHGNDHFRNIELSPSHQIFDPTWGPDHNVNTALQGANLSAQRNPAIHLRGEQSYAPRNRLDRPIDLQGKLPGGSKNQSTGSSSYSTLHTFLGESQQALDQRCAKRNGLPRTRSTTPQDMATGKGDRNGDSLQRKRSYCSLSTNSLRDALSQTQVTELETLSRVGSDRCRFQSLVRNDGYRLTLRIPLRAALVSATTRGSDIAVSG
jgi:hypothetical protein